MRWYQPIECDKTVKNPLVCDYSNLEELGYTESDFKIGKFIDNWNENVFVQAREPEDDGDPDDALQTILMLPIFSPRLMEELNKASIEGIQYLPIKVLRPNNECIEGFNLVNIINFVEAFDEENSIFSRFSEDFPNPNVRGQIAGARKYVLKKDKLEGLDIIRLKEFKQAFFVSEKFKKVFVKNKFTGYSFREIELT